MVQNVVIEAEAVAERCTEAAPAMDDTRRCGGQAAEERGLPFLAASRQVMQTSRSWPRNIIGCLSASSPLSKASTGVQKQGFHSTPAVSAKQKKTTAGSGQTEDKKKKVNNKASYKKQKRMEDKAKLNEFRDWFNGQTSTDQGFTYIFSSGQTFFTSEVFTASQRRRARQSRRDRDAQWFGTWDQWEPRGFRRTSGSWGDMDMHDFWDRVFGGQHFGEEQGEEKPEEDTGRKQRARKSRARTRDPSDFETAEPERKCPHRTCLDLPQRGPLTVAVVKEAFRKQALKWHPDRHVEVSKADAEKRFKDAVTAYDALKLGAFS